ncbi:MAG: isoprenylcysteine carboxylmethyltransferase family protein [Gemmatimonadales bacterium]|nr:isoprenylcysteine carboxylmethyltransferase family protein [Gemmatimonadales bacterium]
MPSTLSSVGLPLRSILWALLLPGIIAGYLPWRFFGLREVGIDLTAPSHRAGLLCVGIGAPLLLACIVEFARSGRGTLAPVDPPKELVVQGLYRYVRNPMYLAVALLLAGEFLLTFSRGLLAFGLIWFVWINLFVILYEEPALTRKFGASYERYKRDVRRWVPTFSSPRAAAAPPR